MKYFLVLCLLFCGFSGLAQKYYTGYYQENDNATELKTVPINSKENDPNYGNLPWLIKFNIPSKKAICDYVYDKQIDRNWQSVNDNAPEVVKSAAVTGIVTCKNEIFNQKFLLPDGTAYTGPFYAIDNNVLFVRGNCLEGYLIDTIEFINYAIVRQFIAVAIQDNPYRLIKFDYIDSAGRLLYVFKKVSDQVPTTSCTNLIFQYFSGDKEYLLQSWGRFSTLSTNPVYCSAHYTNFFLKDKSNYFTLIGSGKNSVPSNANIFRSSVDYRHYELQNGQYIRLDTKELPYNLYVGTFAYSWYFSFNETDKRQSRQFRIDNAFYEKPKGISVFIDSNNHILGAIQKPDDGTAIQYFPDSTYKCSELRFRREDESGAVFYLLLKDFKPLQPKTIKINDIRELLATPKDFWGCKSCVEQE